MDPINHFRLPPSSPIPNIFNFNQPPTPSPLPLQQQQKTLSQPRQIHRNRISYSCHACRRRKVKCDRQHPVCSNCTKTAESCVYDDHAVNSAKSKDEKTQKPEGGAKRRRTNEGVSTSNDGSEGGFSRGNRANGNGQTATAIPPPRPLGANKETELETRMNRLAEIVDRWYKDASAHGIHPDSLTTRKGPRTAGRDSSSVAAGLAENGFAQGQAYLDMLQQSTGPIRHDSTETNHSASASPSPTHTLSPNIPTTPGSSIGGRSQDHIELDGSRTSQLTIKIINEKIEAARQSGKDDDVDDLGIGHLSIQGGGRSRYVGTSFWGLLSSEINELNEVLKTHTHFDRIGDAKCEKHFEKTKDSPSVVGSNSESPPAAPAAPQPQRHPGPGAYLSGCPQAALAMFNKASFLQFEPREIEARTCEVVPTILKALPDKKFADHLYKSFLHGVHPVMPLLHAPTFDADYKCFWKWYPENQHKFPDSKLRENPTFLPLLIAVLYSGAISMSNKTIQRLTGGEYTKEELSGRLYGATMSALVACAFPRSPTVNSLISFLVVQTCLIREEEPLTSCSFVGMAMRVAQSMGLHRDGSLFGLSEIECEVRRRVWWHIMYLDVQGAIATGLPPLGGSGDDLYDTKMVSELKDEYIGLPPGAADPVTPMTPHNARCQEFHKEKIDIRSSPAMILAVGRYESTILLRVIITRLFAIRGSKRSDLMEMGKMIYELKMKLEKMISRIPARGIPEMGFIPPRDPKESEVGAESTEVERAVVFNSWARIMLSLLSDRAFGVLYQPFLKSAKSNMWKHARNCALHFCHSFLRKFLHLSRTQLFQPYQWFCPGTYQPLHATMILLLDLHERPFALEAPKSRNFVDEVFAIFGEHGNYSTSDGEGGNRPLMEGGREAWRMLWRLRKKAYEKSGVRIPAEQEQGGRGEQQEKTEEEKAEEAQYYPNFPQYAVQHTTMPQSPAPPFPNINMRLATPPPQPPPSQPVNSNDAIGCSFEELLEMDTIIDAEDKAFFTGEVVAHFLQKEQSHDVELRFGLPEEGTAQRQEDNQFDPMAGGQDMMDFDWEEWDQVFGKYASVDLGEVL